MRFKVSMINDLGNYHEETVITNNEKKEIRNVKTFNPQSKVIKAKWGSK